jgi:hypothetical protein
MGFLTAVARLIVLLLVFASALEDVKPSQDSDTTLPGADASMTLRDSVNIVDLKTETDVQKEHQDALKELRTLLFEAQQAVATLSKALNEQEKRMSTLYGIQIETSQYHIHKREGKQKQISLDHSLAATGLPASLWMMTI